MYAASLPTVEFGEALFIPFEFAAFSFPSAALPVTCVVGLGTVVVVVEVVTGFAAVFVSRVFPLLLPPPLPPPLHALGSLCIVDFKPRELSPSQRGSVRRLAQQAMTQLELRRQLLVGDALVHELPKTKAAAETGMATLGYAAAEHFARAHCSRDEGDRPC